MLLIYTILQITIRKLIDILMTFWLWANKRLKQEEEQKQHDRK